MTQAPSSRRGWLDLAAPHVPTFLIALAIFWLAYDGGTYSVESRAAVAIVVWWALAVCVGAGLLPRAKVGWPAWVAAASFAGLAALAAASSGWGTSAERAVNEGNRVALLLGVLVLAVFAGRRADVERWANGLAIGLVAVALLALASRFFPSHFSEGDIPQFLPSAHVRLSYPVGYWNGLAVLVALAIPLLLRAAVAARHVIVQAAAVAPIPALAAVIYLASSRGGAVAAAVGAASFLALTSRRWAAAGAFMIAALGSAATIAVLHARDELVNGPLPSAAASSEGHSAAAIVAAVCVLAGATYALLAWRFPRSVSPSSRVGWATAIVVVAVAAVGTAAAHPMERFNAFKRVPSYDSGGNYVQAHLLSTSGNGRWQYWRAAIDQFKAHRLLGGGAGSYEGWWAQHGNLSGFVQDAHSLYAELLGELGVVGFSLLALPFGLGLLMGLRRLFRRSDDGQASVAALCAVFLAYALSTGFDWMWETTVVSIVGIACLGLLVGPATRTARSGRRDGATPPDRRRGLPIAPRMGLAALALLVIGSQAISLLSSRAISQSQAAVERGDAGRALSTADTARALQPWASSPDLQLALVEERLGDLLSAHRWIRAAIRRDSSDWRLWLVAARIETRAGSIGDARSSLRRAKALNPRSPLFRR